MLLRRVVFAGAIVLAGAIAASEELPEHGLMWNRTGLPATFPLQIKTLAGQDYVLVLVDADSGAESLAAFITGGRFFKVLVPPGTYEVVLTYGDVWQGDVDGYGAAAQYIVLPEALTFEVREGRIRSGHLVDLTQRARDGRLLVTVKDQSICQRWALTDLPRPIVDHDPDDDAYEPRVRNGGRFPEARFDTNRLQGRADEVRPKGGASTRLAVPRFGSKSRPC
ncbi:MAG: hypothetical protein AAGI36_07945 [Pseudomonadota bacterium]